MKTRFWSAFIRWFHPRFLPAALRVIVRILFVLSFVLSPAAATADDSATTCAPLLSTRAEKAHAAYATLVKKGVEQKILDATVLELALEAAKLGEILNLFQGGAYSSDLDGYKSALQKLIASRELQAPRVVEILQPALTRAAASYEIQNVVKTETQFILGLAPVEEKEAQLWAELRRPEFSLDSEGRTWAYNSKPNSDENAFRFDIANPENLVPQTSRFETIQIALNKSGEELHIGVRNIDRAEVVNATQNRTIFETTAAPGGAHSTGFYKSRKNETYAVIAEEGTEFKIHAFDIENPEKVYQMLSPDIPNLARSRLSQLQVVTLANGEEAFLFTARSYQSSRKMIHKEIYLWRFKISDQPEFLQKFSGNVAHLYDSPQGGGVLLLSNETQSSSESPNSIEVIPADPQARERKSWLQSTSRRIKEKMRATLRSIFPGFQVDLEPSSYVYYWGEESSKRNALLRVASAPFQMLSNLVSVRRKFGLADFQSLFVDDDGQTYGVFVRPKPGGKRYVVLVDLRDLRRQEIIDFEFDESYRQNHFIVFRNGRGQRVLAYNTRTNSGGMGVALRNLNDPTQEVARIETQWATDMNLRYVRSGKTERILATPVGAECAPEVFDINVTPRQAEVNP